MKNTCPIAKSDFPLLSRQQNGKPIVYLDNAATSQKPTSVITAVTDYYLESNANVHRGVYQLSEESTEIYELARAKVASFIGSPRIQEVVFTKGTTEAINLVAFGDAAKVLKPGDEILTSYMEHHSNLVPWQVVAKKTGTNLKFIEHNNEGVITSEELNKKLTTQVKIVALTHVSNVLGVINPVKQICTLAKSIGALIIIDGAQAVPSIPVNIDHLGCDFYAFSGHKMLGPTGIGVLWGKSELLADMDPYLYGGGMIELVYPESCIWAQPPARFEAGTPNMAGAAGLSAAIDYLNNIGLEKIHSYEQEPMAYLLPKLNALSGIKILGSINPENRVGIVSFSAEGIHPHDLATVLGEEGVCVRAGHHCAMPLHENLKIPASTRASFYLYNTLEDADALMEAIQKALKLLK